MSLYSVRMRASQGERHISGAERIVSAVLVSAVSEALTRRALSHPLGIPDSINISVEKLSGPIMKIPALGVLKLPSPSVDHSMTMLRGFLIHNGYSLTALELLRTVSGLRGAMLIDAHSGERLDDTADRGVRVSMMDWENTAVPEQKDPFMEALALASKILHHPNIVAELCISDDPNYTTGYYSYDGKYFRLPNCKERGEKIGTRVFLYDGPREEVTETINYLQHTPVLIQEP